MSVTKEELKKHLGLIYGVASHNPGLNTPANRELIWAFAKKIVSAEQQKLIDAAETPDEKLLVLNLILLQLAQEPDFSLPPDLNELVAQYEKHLEQKRAEVQAKAAPELYVKQLALLKQIPRLEPIAENVAADLILEPEKTLVSLAKFFPPEELAPLIPEVSHPVIENVYLQTFQIIPQPAAAAAVTVLKIATPQVTIPQIQQLLDRLTLSSEAIGKPLHIPQTAAAGLSKIQAPLPSFPPLTLSLQNQFLKAGYPTPQAQALASQFASQFVPLINTISSHTPHQPNDSPQTYVSRVSQVQIYFSNQVIEYLALRTVYFTSPVQYYSSQASFSPNSPLARDQAGWFNYLVGFGKDKIQDKVASAAWQKFAASEVGKKVLTSLGTKAATTAATVGVEAAAGPPGWILAAVTVLATFGKDILSWAKRNFKKLAVAIGAAIGLLIGGPVGAVFGAVGGFVVASPLVSLSATTNSIGTGITSASTAMVGLVATEIAAPIIVIGLSIPIVIALLLFIINTSALVVPPHKGAFPLSVSTPDFVVAGTCPVTENPYISRGSLGGLSDRAHGDASYGPHCYGIPIEGMWLWYDKPANDPSFLACPKSAYSCNGPTCPYYGFAADVKSSTNTNAVVILPKICSKESSSTECGDMTWRVTSYLYNCNGGSTSSREECTREQGGAERTYWGWGVVFESDSNGHHWKLYLNHIDPKFSPGIGQTFKSGQVFATITKDYPDHTHIELIVDGVPARPDYLCAK